MAPAIVSDIELPAHVPETRETAASKASTFKLFSLENKTVAITGGARGLGITLAIAVVEAGGSVACLDILEEPSPAEWARLNKIATANKASVSYRKCDVTEEQSVETAMKEIAAEADLSGAPFWGTIACAGIQQQIAALDYPAADFDCILRVNVTGVFNTCKYAARVLREKNSPGSIVIIGSMSGNIANRGLSCTAYNSSKAAVQQMCRSVAQEWGQYGIRVNTLSPGYIRTAMTDQLLQENPEVEKTWMAGALLGRLGAPEDFKAPAVFLLSEGASFVHGADLRVDGGHCASA
ncbi:D-arabinitol 2-dehydrogenase [Fusarium subglutinans]|uniref:D-arabinitol 2-dehydrogenase n=1 Tax=Gibberella subglutinans TaxID=42677 RepID=A0A8H5V9K6_GIBSU|nr:D-arabinitol 2-dehydrogenase [Fusarium subglutinans]KAF5613234.1 D-arabinitol 2-dehydrogenase [Fusarium subglutinans]